MRYEPNSPIPLPADAPLTALPLSDASISDLITRIEHLEEEILFLEEDRERLAIHAAFIKRDLPADADDALNDSDMRMIGDIIDRMEENNDELNRDLILERQELEDFEGHQFGE